MNSLRFFRYTQRRSPASKPRAFSAWAKRLLRTSRSSKVLVASVPFGACQSNAGSPDRPHKGRSKRWMRFMLDALSRNDIRRCFLSAVILSLLLVTGCRNNTQRARRVQIATYSQDSLTALPLVLAQQLGYFEQEELTVNVEEMASGAKAMQALLGGSADVASAFYELTMQMAGQRRDLTSFVSLARYPGYVVIASPVSAKKVRRVEDLRGAMVAISSPGS